jgi:CRP-like cAMP-binding protein
MNQQQVEQAFINFFNQKNDCFKPDGFSALGIEGKLQHYDKGELLIRQGDVAPDLFFLATGLVRYVSVSPEGKAFTQSFIPSPSIAGSTRAMVNQVSSQFSIEVLEPVVCLKFNWLDFFDRMKTQPGFLETYVHMLEGLFIKKEERENSFVKMDAEQRYLLFLEQHGNLFDRVPLQYIASYIGITPVALSRVRKKLNPSV